MRIVISGASGFVGKMLVPELLKWGHQVILLGRNPEALRRDFPESYASNYTDVKAKLDDVDVFLNLAVRNNNQGSDYVAMCSVNVDFASLLAKAATEAGVSRFVNVSSIHALDPNDARPYASSKRDGVSAVDAATGGRATHLYLPAVVGESFAGALSPLNVLPKPLAKILLGPLSALKPILPVSEFADWVMNVAMTSERHVILTKGQRGNPYYAVASRGLDLIASAFGLGSCREVGGNLKAA